MRFSVATWPPSWPEIEAATMNSLSTGDWGNYFSQAHAVLTQALARQFQVEFVRLCSSGTAAIEISLRAANVSSGDDVVIAAFDYPGNVRCIEAVGARPVLVDVSHEEVCASVDQINAAAGPNVRAVIVSHLFGQAADVIAIRQLCDDRGWTLIEDACQVPGMQISIDDVWRPVGSFGHVATLSFGGSKPLTAGNGGAVLTSDPRINARLKMLLDRPSDTFPLSALQAAVVLPQLDRLGELNSQRAATVNALFELGTAEFETWQLLGKPSGTVKPSYYKFAFLAQTSGHRTRIIRSAEMAGIPIGEGFRSLHRMSENRCRKPMPLEQCERLGEQLCVLDHRALMIEPGRHRDLIDVLRRIHDESR